MNLTVCVEELGTVYSECITVSMGVGRIFSRGGQKGIFPKYFPGGAKSGEICFLPLEIEKVTFFANNFKIQGLALAPPAPLPTPMTVSRQRIHEVSSQLVSVHKLKIGHCCNLFSVLIENLFFALINLNVVIILSHVFFRASKPYLVL